MMKQAGSSWSAWRWLAVATTGLVLAAGGLRLGCAATPGMPVASPILAGQVMRFEEPLVPTVLTSREEDTALQAAITAAQRSAVPDSFASLEGFLASHPRSGWNAALLTNLGLLYFRSGYLSKALVAFDQAWTDGASVQEVHAKALVDRAVGELLFMQTRLGDAKTLQDLLGKIGGRSLSGPATEMLAGAKQRLWYLTQPQPASHPFSPRPLKNLLLAVGALPNAVSFLDAYSPTAPNTTLAQLGQLATQAQLPSRIIYRVAGSPVPIPSIVHWKVNHFAAIVGRSNGGFVVVDPAFGQSTMHFTAGAFEAESSGFFLVPGGQNAPQWRDATSTEASQIISIGSNR